MKRSLLGALIAVLAVTMLAVSFPIIVRLIFFLGAVYVAVIGALILIALTMFIVKTILIPYYALKKSGEKASKGVTLSQLKEKEER